MENGSSISAFDVANYFLVKANSEGDLITHLKMQKLLYYAQAWHLVNFGEPLFKERICPWNLGPVVEEVYHELKVFRASPIKYEATGNEESVFTDTQKTYLDEFYDYFIKYSAHELVNMSHNESPWKEAHKNEAPFISLESMKQFYTDLLASHKGSVQK